MTLGKLGQQRLATATLTATQPSTGSDRIGGKPGVTSEGRESELLKAVSTYIIGYFITNKGYLRKVGQFSFSSTRLVRKQSSRSVLLILLERRTNDSGMIHFYKGINAEKKKKEPAISESVKRLHTE